MSFYQKTIDTTILYKVLSHIPAISKAGDNPRNTEYKSMNSNTGDVYLITHPQFWEERENGTKIRPTPKLMMTYEEAKKDAQNHTAASFIGAL